MQRCAAFMMKLGLLNPNTPQLEVNLRLETVEVRRVSKGPRHASAPAKSVLLLGCAMSFVNRGTSSEANENLY